MRDYYVGGCNDSRQIQLYLTGIQSLGSTTTSVNIPLSSVQHSTTTKLFGTRVHKALQAAGAISFPMQVNICPGVGVHKLPKDDTQ